MKTIIRFTSSERIKEKNEWYQNKLKEMKSESKFITINYMNLYYYEWFRFLDSWKKIPEGDIYRFWWKAWAWMWDWIRMFYHDLMQEKCLDESRSRYSDYWSKFLQSLFFEHYKYTQPNFLFLVAQKKIQEDQIKRIESCIPYPIIAKEVLINRWKGVHLIENKSMLGKFLSEHNSEDILFQEFFQNDCDYRAITVWNKCIWCFKKIRTEKSEFRNNVSLWARVEPFELENKQQEELVKIAQWYQLSISWIDFFLDNWKIVLIEINKLPEYGWFENATGISFHQEVLEYLLND